MALILQYDAIGFAEERKRAIMDHNEPVAVYSTTDLADAEVVRAYLEGQGIKTAIEGGNQGGFVGVLQSRVLVRAEDADRAREVLKSDPNPHEGRMH
jgi:hypothetical protein